MKAWRKRRKRAIAICAVIDEGTRTPVRRLSGLFLRQLMQGPLPSPSCPFQNQEYCWTSRENQKKPPTRESRRLTRIVAKEAKDRAEILRRKGHCPTLRGSMEDEEHEFLHQVRVGSCRIVDAFRASISSANLTNDVHDLFSSV